MSFWKFWKNKSKKRNGLRIIETVRGKEKIEIALKNGFRLINRNVEPFSDVTGKYCFVKNKKTGRKIKLYDFRDERAFSDEYEIVQDWTYQYFNYSFPDEAAYVIPDNIKEDEIVFVEDLIENFLGYYHNQGDSERLKGCKAIWKNNDLQILYIPQVNIIRAVG